MTNTTPVRPGQINATGDEFATFLRTAAFEILMAYQNQARVRPLIRSRTIPYGESVKFGALGNASAKRHLPGQDILDPSNAFLSQMPFGQKIINLDQKLLSAEFLDSVEEMMTEFEVRGPITQKLGTAIALQDDFELTSLLALGARSTAGATSDHGLGRVIWHVDLRTDVAQLKKAIREVATIMDERNVQSEGRFMVLRPRQFHQLVQDGEFISKDYNSASNGDKSKATLWYAEGILLIPSNQIPSTSISSTLLSGGPPATTAGTRNEYGGNYTGTVAVAGTSRALGAGMLQGLVTEVEYYQRFQGTLMTASMTNGKAVLAESDCFELNDVADPVATSLTNYLDLTTV